MENIDTLIIHHFIKSTKTLGPYNRFGLWLQGCNQNCAGCMSLKTKDNNKGMNISILQLAQEIINCEDVEGITISGGEPFLQAEGLLVLLKEVKSCMDLGVIIYTGYYLDELKNENKLVINQILENYCDLLIDGPYIKELNSEQAFVGSSNQTIHRLTNRYDNVFESYYNCVIRRTEIHIKNNEAFIIGIPSKSNYSLWEKLFKK